MLLAGTALLLGASVLGSDFHLEVGWLIGPGTITIAAAATPLILSCDDPLRAAFRCASHLIGFYLVATPLSYVVASGGAPLVDDTLFAADRALGFDWLGYVSFAERHDCLGLIFKLAYGSLLPQLLLLIFLGARINRPAFHEKLTLSIMISALITIGISGLLPAMANYVHLGLTAADFPNLSPDSAFVHVADLSALRNGSMRELNLSHESGIITFPSYHAALAVIFGLAFWQLKHVRWAGLFVNVLMMSATPIYGGHYLVDLLGGSVVGCFAVCVATLFTADRTGKLGSALAAMVHPER